MLEHFGAGPIAGEESDPSWSDPACWGQGALLEPAPLDRANLVVPAAWAVSGRRWVTWTESMSETSRQERNKEVGGALL